MSHAARVVLERGDHAFTDRKYSRRYRIEFDGGAIVPGSSSPEGVKAPYSDPAAVDPEEAFVASLAGCHMLWFLDIASFSGDRVPDAAEIARMHHEAHEECFIASSVKTEVRCEPR